MIFNRVVMLVVVICIAVLAATSIVLDTRLDRQERIVREWQTIVDEAQARCERLGTCRVIVAVPEEDQ